PVPEGRDGLQGPVLVAVVAELRELEGIAIGRGVPRPEDEEAIRVRERQRAQQHAVDHAEDRGIGADTEREGDQGHQREARSPREAARRVAYVLDQALHRASPSASRADKGQYDREEPRQTERS